MIGSLFVIIVTILLIALHLKKKSEKEKNFPPGPTRWPVVGSIPQMLMASPKYAHLQLTGLAKKYGPIMSFGYGVHYAVVVSEYDLLKDLLRQPESNEKRFVPVVLDKRDDNKNLGIIFSEGESWKEQKRYTLKLLRQFGYGRKHSMEETIQVEVNDLVKDIQKETSLSHGIWKTDINRFAILTVNTLWASVGGYRFDPQSPHVTHQLDLIHRSFASFGAGNLLNVFPFLKKFPNWSGYRESCEIQQECREFTLELLEEVKKKRGSRAEPESFIEAYLDEIELNKGKSSVVLTADQLVLTVMDLFLSGTDSTPSAMYWILLYLGLYPEEQEKIREEIKHFASDKFTKISSTEYPSMVYLNAFIFETLRHAPFIPILNPRMITDDIQCAGYTIPKNTCLFPNIHPILYDTKYWSDPENFRPSRLIRPDGTLDKDKVDRIAVFGFGTRECPGQNFAHMAMDSLVTTLLQNFSLTTVPEREPSLAMPAPSLLMKPWPFLLKVTNLN